MIKIVGHPIRHKKRMKEIEARFKGSGEEVNMVYKNTNHITIINDPDDINNIETTTKRDG